VVVELVVDGVEVEVVVEVAVEVLLVEVVHPSAVDDVVVVEEFDSRQWMLSNNKQMQLLSLILI
jgi:hypothetical protein